MALLLTLAVIFIIIAVVSWLVGARGFAWFSWGIAKFFVAIFVVLFLIALFFGFLVGL